MTNCDIIEVLISSHIVPWSECNDDERLDVENGILLSPNVDSLFDKHLISFSDSGEILTSNSITQSDLERLGISTKAIIPITDGMKQYLSRHRKIMNGKG